MRAILIDWLVDVHLKFQVCLPPGAVPWLHSLPKDNVWCLVWLQYEEIWAPEVRDFVYVSDRAYTRDQILNMEKVGGVGGGGVSAACAI